MKNVGVFVVVLGWIAAIILCLRPDLALRLRLWLAGFKRSRVHSGGNRDIILLTGGTDGQEEKDFEQDAEEAEEISQGDPRSGPDPPFR